MLENQLSRYGAIAKALPLMSPGAKVFFLAPSSAAWFGDFQHEFPPDKQGFVRVHTTIASVISNGGVVANRGDVVLALPGYTETLTAVQSLTVAGVSWIGVGDGGLKPTITVNGAVHGIALSANNVLFKNFNFAAPATDAALSMVRIDDDCTGCTIEDVSGIGSNAANNFVHCIRIGIRAHNHTLKNIRLTTSKALAVTAFLHFDGVVSISNIGGFYAVGSVATAGIMDATGAAIYNAIWNNMFVAVGGAGSLPALTIDGTGGPGSNGIVTNCHFAGTHTTLASNASFAGDWRLSDVYLNEATGNASQAALIPAADTD